MHVRLCVDHVGGVKFAAWDSSREEYYNLCPEYAGACFAGEPGADPIESVEVAGVDFESAPVGRVGTCPNR